MASSIYKETGQIELGGKVYEATMTGFPTVDANPEDEATETLEKLTVGKTTYSVDGESPEPGPTPSGGYVIYAEDTEQSGGWDCPKLTVQQVTDAYNVLADGKSLTVVSEDENVQFRAVLGDASTGEASIVLQYYWLGWIDYQVTAQNTVAITTHSLPEVSAHQITSITMGTDTIDLTVS